MKKPIIICIILVLAVIIHYIWSLGVFDKQKIAEGDFGPYKYVYENHVGPYHETGKVFEELYKSLKNDGIETVKGIGIYYDNPQKVSANKLRSDCGIVIPESDYSRLEKLSKKYKVKDFKEAQFLYTTFPIKNTLSYMIGPMLMYPKLQHYFDKTEFKEPGYSVEIYDETNNIIYFAIPIEKK